MNKFIAFFVAIGNWFKRVGIAIGKWFKNWFVPVDGKAIIPVRIGRWVKSLFVRTDAVEEPRLKTLARSNGFKSVMSSVLCILCGIIIGMIILLVVGLVSKDVKSGDIVRGLLIILVGPLYTGSRARIEIGIDPFTIGNMLLTATPLICTGLSVAIAFKTGLFNIGAPGQFLMGTMMSIIVALGIPVTTPFGGFCVWLLALLCGMLAGALWGAIPGLFKALLGVNEVIVCIMTNWIAANLVSWVFSGSQFINGDEGKTGYLYNTFHNNVSTPRLLMDKIFPGSWADGGIIIAILLAVVIFIILNKTTFGFELKACGSNRNAAKYAGMHDKRNIVLSMAIAGALAGAGASLYYLNGNTEFYWNTYMSLPSEGFNGIPIALLASSHPVGVIFAASYMAFLTAGGGKLGNFTAFNSFIADLIIAVIIYFAGFSNLFRQILSGRKKKNAGGSGENTDGNAPVTIAPVTAETATDGQPAAKEE